MDSFILFSLIKWFITIGLGIGVLLAYLYFFHPKFFKGAVLLVLAAIGMFLFKKRVYNKMLKKKISNLETEKKATEKGIEVQKKERDHKIKERSEVVIDISKKQDELKGIETQIEELKNERTRIIHSTQEISPEDLLSILTRRSSDP